MPDWDKLELLFGGVYTIGLLCAGYVLRFLIERSHEREMEAMKAGYQRELEVVKAELERTSVRFTKLHEDRAEIIKEMYNQVAGAYAQLDVVLQIVATKGSRDQFESAVLDIGQKVTVLTKFIDSHRIYFAERQIAMLQELIDSTGEAMQKLFPQYDRTVMNLDEFKAVIKSKMSPALKMLRTEFRTMLGVEEDPA